jgi:hypothetical protein
MLFATKTLLVSKPFLYLFSYLFLRRTFLFKMTEKLRELAQQLQGEFYFDKTIRTLYATDASAYREMPLAVAIPKSVDDIKKLIRFANQNHTSLIPRTAGTSLAGH